MKRIVLNEFGIEIFIKDVRLFGVYDYMYDDNFDVK